MIYRTSASKISINRFSISRIFISRISISKISMSRISMSRIYLSRIYLSRIVELDQHLWCWSVVMYMFVLNQSKLLLDVNCGSTCISFSLKHRNLVFTAICGVRWCIVCVSPVLKCFRLSPAKPYYQCLRRFLASDKKLRTYTWLLIETRFWQSPWSRCTQGTDNALLGRM